MIEEIKNNLDTEVLMIKELFKLEQLIPTASNDEKRMIPRVIESVQKRLKILNNSTGDLIKAASLATKLPGKETKLEIEKIEFNNSGAKVAVRSRDKDRYLKELDLSEELIRRMKRRATIIEERDGEFKSANFFAKISNNLFLKTSNKLLDKGYFKNMNIDLRKGNILVLTATYISMMLFSILIAVLSGFGLAAFFFFFKATITSPFIAFNDGEVFRRIGISVAIFFGVPLLTFAGFYFYPGTERKSLTRRIESELPFVVIHMGSISGSGIEPTQIFKIVGLHRDYKYTKVEIRKLINQVNVYGYDLITALKNIARLTPSSKLAELFNGLATTISSGGDLKIFFEKRAESLLLSYKLEREKFIRVAETFMDIYISVVIATPMILLILLVMISVTGVNVGGFGIGTMTFLIVFSVAMVNVIFLWLLSLKQPAY